MSKFHDEFFKKGSAKHDKLVEQTIASIEDIFKESILPEINNTQWPIHTEKIYVCNGSECPNFCKIKIENTKLAFTRKPICCYYINKGNYREKKLVINEDAQRCEYCVVSKDNQKYLNSDINVELNETYNYCSNKNVISVNAQVYGVSTSVEMVDIEPEKICKNGNFIIGYADIKSSFSVEYRLDCKIDDNWVWKNYSSAKLFVDVVVECKPDLSTWGGPLRQVKTYMDIIRCNNERDLYNDRERRSEKRIVIGLFTTYSVLPEKIKELLKKENIFVATLPSEDTN